MLLACRWSPTINPCCSFGKLPRIGPRTFRNSWTKLSLRVSNQAINSLYNHISGLQPLCNLSLQPELSHNSCLYVHAKVESRERCCFPRRTPLCLRRGSSSASRIRWSHPRYLLRAWTLNVNAGPWAPTRSDADADVLADFVLALLHHDDGSEDVKSKCMSEMGNFLTEGRTWWRRVALLVDSMLNSYDRRPIVLCQRPFRNNTVQILPPGRTPSAETSPRCRSSPCSPRPRRPEHRPACHSYWARRWQRAKAWLPGPGRLRRANRTRPIPRGTTVQATAPRRRLWRSQGLCRPR